MLADDFEHGAVWKPLFVIAEPGRCVDTGEDGCLSGRALRAAFNPQARVGGDDHPILDRSQRFILKNRQRLRALKTVKWIEWPARTYSQAVNEK